MLKIQNFDIYGDIMHYMGDAEYTISPDYPVNHEVIGGYTITVTDIDDNGDAYDAGTYTASTLSTAIAIIERLEAGEAE